MTAAATLMSAAARSPTPAPLTLHRKICHVLSGSVAHVPIAARRGNRPAPIGLVAFTSKSPIIAGQFLGVGSPLRYLTSC
jgi:hypothetical protein